MKLYPIEVIFFLNHKSILVDSENEYKIEKNIENTLNLIWTIFFIPKLLTTIKTLWNKAWLVWARLDYYIKYFYFSLGKSNLGKT